MSQYDISKIIRIGIFGAIAAILVDYILRPAMFRG